MIDVLASVSPLGDSQTVTTPTTAAAAPTVPASAMAAAVEQANQKSTEAPAEPSLAELKQAAKQLETFMQSMNRYLEFRVDQDSGRTVVTVKDKTTGDTVRQIPSEEVLRLAQNLGGKAHTGLVSQTA